APADIGDARVDLVVSRMRVLSEECGDRHDHSRLAVTALRHLVVDPRLLHAMQRAVLGEPLDGRDARTLSARGLEGARADGAAVDVHGAGAAGGDSAAELRAGQAEPLSDRP